MILIFSKPDDSSTEKVMRWIRSRSTVSVARINSDAVAGRQPEVELNEDGFVMVVDGQRIHSSAVTATWYRKGTFWFDEMDADASARLPGIEGRLKQAAALESRKAKEYVHHVLARHTRVLAHADIGRINKLIVLEEAARCGLATPAFTASNRSSSLREFASRGRVITKAMGNGLYYWDYESAKKAYFTYTERVTDASLEELSDGAGMHFVQHEISKQYEVRTFYLDGRTWSCAILSQGDAQTSVDYRKYNQRRITRNVPYRLPPDVASALDRLFRGIGLNTGSVDFMVDHEGRHHFLEINPSGQYEAISERCNFMIDRHIADWLIGTER